MHRLPPVVLASLVLLAPRARGEPCTVTDDDTANGTFSCPIDAPGAPCLFDGLRVSGCTPTNDDFYTFAGNGYSVVADGDVYGQGPRQGFRVAGALSLVFAVENGCRVVTTGHSDDPQRTLPVEDSGLVVDGQGSVTLNGGYLDPDTVAFHPTRPSTYLYVGDLEPCGDGSDCDHGDNRSILRIEWPDARYGGLDGDAGPRMGDVLAAAEPGDLVCFRDPQTTDAIAYAQSGACYVITSLDPSEPAALELDVRQGAIERSGYPLDRRNLARCTVIDAQLCEDRRTACVQDADCLGADRIVGGTGASADIGAGRCHGAGLGFGDRLTLDLGANASCAALFGAGDRGEAQHWIRARLGADPGFPGEQRRIVASRFLDGWQEIRVFPPFAAPPQLGEVVFADHGIRSGDPFWIVRPVRFSDHRLAAMPAPITTAGAALAQDQAGGIVVPNGTLHLVAAHLDRYFSATITYTGGRFGTLQDLALSDTTCRHQGGQCAALGTMLGVRQGATFAVDTASVSGGPSQRCAGAEDDDCGKAFHSNSGSGGALVLREIAARHLGDDCVASHDPTLVASLTHIECAGMADVAGSAQCIEFDGPTYVDGLVCADMLRGDDAIQLFPTATGEARNVVVLGGGAGGGSVFGVQSRGVRFQGFVLLGSNLFDSGDDTFYTLVPLDVDGFWVQDVDIGPVARTGTRILQGNVSVRNGAFVRVRLFGDNAGGTIQALATGPVQPMPGVGVLSNVAFVDVEIEVDPANPGSQDFTILQRPNHQGAAARFEHLAFVSNRAWDGAEGLVRLLGVTGPCASPQCTSTITHRNHLFYAPRMRPSPQIAWQEEVVDGGGDYWNVTLEGDFCFRTAASDYGASTVGPWFDLCEAAGTCRRLHPLQTDLVAPQDWLPRVDTPAGSTCGAAGVKRGDEAPGVDLHWALSRIGGRPLRMRDPVPSCGFGMGVLLVLPPLFWLQRAHRRRGSQGARGGGPGTTRRGGG
jgi:hypothetical protein